MKTIKNIFQRIDFAINSDLIDRINNEREFLLNTFPVLAKADGRIDEREKNFLAQVLCFGLGVPEEKIGEVIENAQELKTDTIEQFISFDDNTAIKMIRLLIELSLVDGHFHMRERELIASLLTAKYTPSKAKQIDIAVNAIEKEILSLANLTDPN